MQLKPIIQSTAKRARVGTLLPLALVTRLYGGTDKWAHGYTPFYERHVGARRWRSNRILEIGVGGYASPSPSGSLRIWRDYFPLSNVVGLDIEPKSVSLGKRVGFVRGDQACPDDLDQAVEALGGPPNIVIDDGSHYIGHAIASFEYLFPLMPSGSVYVVEDIHTSYWEDFGGQIEPHETTAVGMAKGLIHSVQARDTTFALHAEWAPTPKFDRADVAALHVYPGIFFVEKG